MRLLFLGFSSIAERRVIQAAAGLAAIDEISIASRTRRPAGGWPKAGQLFTDYEAALHEAGSDMVYVSLPNVMHERWVMAALAAGKHVIVDKPAMMALETSRRAVAEARRRRLLLAEATVFSYHPQFDHLARFLAEAGPLTHVATQFIVPPLPMGNFRNHTELGGGCLFDMGPYAASAMRLLGGGRPNDVSALAGGRHPETGVDTGFSVQARLANGAIFSGHFSFEGEYQNRLLAVSRSGSVVVERIFSPPADYKLEWRRRIRNVESVVSFDPADTFAHFLDAVCRAVASGDCEKLYCDLIGDAEIRQQVADALYAVPRDPRAVGG